MAGILFSRAVPLRSAFRFRAQHVGLSPAHAAQHRRSFHPSQPRQFGVETPVAMAYELFQTVHSVGLPWVLSIPATALIVRMVVGLPQQKFVMVHQRRKVAIAPVLQAWDRIYRREIMDKYYREGIQIRPHVVSALTPAHVAITRYQMYKSWKIKTWAPYTAVFLLPVWLSMIEALRRMSGFPSIFGAENTTSAPLEPSLATEDALWFPDLLVADPYILPFMLSATLFTNVTWGWKVPTWKEISLLPTVPRRNERVSWILKRSLQFLGLASGVFAHVNGVPAAILIYWISSTAFATLQRWWLKERIMKNQGLPKVEPEMGVQVGKPMSSP